MFLILQMNYPIVLLALVFSSGLAFARIGEEQKQTSLLDIEDSSNVQGDSTEIEPINREKRFLLKKKIIGAGLLGLGVGVGVGAIKG